MLNIRFNDLFSGREKALKNILKGRVHVSGAYTALLIALLNESPYKDILIVTSDMESASAVSAIVKGAMQNPELGVFPLENTPVDNALMKKKFVFFDKFYHADKRIVVSSLKGMFDPVISKEASKKIVLTEGDSFKQSQLIKILSQFGYRRTKEIENQGEFSVKGDVVDIYPYSFDSPLRIDFEFDKIVRIKIFSLETMLSIKNVEKVEISPFSFFGVQDSFIQEIEKNVLAAVKDSNKYLKDIVLEDLTSLKQHENLGISYYASFLGKGVLGYESLIDLTSNFEKFFVGEPPFDSFLSEAEEVYKKSLEAKEIYDVGFDRVEKAVHLLREGNTVYLDRTYSSENTVDLGITQVLDNFSALSSLKEFVLSYLKEKSVVIITTQFERVRELLSLYELTPKLKFTREKGLYLLQGSLDRGIETDKMIIITDKELFPHYELQKTRKKILFSKGISSVEELNDGDYVVHKNFGIGVFRGLKTIERNGVQKEYLLIEYRGGEKLYVPMERISSVERYIGDRRIVALNRLHGDEWNKTKKKAAENARLLAMKLLRIEAERKLKGGFSFKPYPTEEKILALSFPYELTNDQKTALSDVLSDMEKNEPMDRLVCGDVGYGKTEIAVRAAFRAVMNGKQVAFLVPTTILAMQHERTLKERLHLFPVEIAMLSRLTDSKRKKEILAGLRNGTIDIVVGTHRLLSKDVKFKDLGLLIIDEEQKFGVKDKERIKEMRANIDLLTLTATPIPRTLHTALINLKSISLINTPPPGRIPIKTFVLPFSWNVVKSAIEFEIGRNGQVFVVHNRIEDIYSFAEKLKHYLGEGVKVGVAHGKMNKYQLEEAMLDFYRGETNVLVSTTIIENGLDIPTVNTLIVDAAENFGLSQMYQIRGRIGRSHINAFAYFLFTPKKGLKAVSEERLETIKEFTGVGAGIKIAMKDLELRGAGNLLGKEQHGHIVSVGYSMYVSLLEEAVAELRGDKKPQSAEAVIRVAERYFIPSDYVPLNVERMKYYRAITTAPDFSAIERIRSEMEDRFGRMPQEVKNLLDIGKCEIIMRDIGVTEIFQENNRIFLSIKPDHNISTEGLKKLIAVDESVRIGKNYLSFLSSDKNIIQQVYFVLNLLSGEKAYV
jgi:transcription-repair coupling factor (superfamily II helicase)